MLASLCRVIVHAPMNHTRLLEVRALSSWNLLDLMTALLQRFDSENSQDHSTSTREPLKLNEFVFFLHLEIKVSSDLFKDSANL